jgi:hypothetical protein
MAAAGARTSTMPAEPAVRSKLRCMRLVIP